MLGDCSRVGGMICSLKVLVRLIGGLGGAAVRLSSALSVAVVSGLLASALNDKVGPALAAIGSLGLYCGGMISLSISALRVSFNRLSTGVMIFSGSTLNEFFKPSVFCSFEVIGLINLVHCEFFFQDNI